HGAVVVGRREQVVLGAELDGTDGTLRGHEIPAARPEPGPRDDRGHAVLARDGDLGTPRVERSVARAVAGDGKPLAVANPPDVDAVLAGWDEERACAVVVDVI